ncbi:MAG: AMP-binding protein, partial [Exiguobacterium chiriqhucha]
MIGYLILIAFWVLATLTVFALSIPYIRKRETKGVIVLLVAVLSLGVYSLYVEGLERMRSAGKALAGVEIAILDPEGNRLPPRQVGEIATRS